MFENFCMFLAQLGYLNALFSVSLLDTAVICFAVGSFLLYPKLKFGIALILIVALLFVALNYAVPALHSFSNSLNQFLSSLFGGVAS